MKTEQLTYEEKTAMAMEAITNWCWNTETHLKEARRLKELKLRLPQTAEGPLRQWVTQTNWLIGKIQKELAKAEVDLMEDIGVWPCISPLDFLDEIPEET